VTRMSQKLVSKIGVRELTFIAVSRQPVQSDMYS
jgi:hypothetical protein